MVVVLLHARLCRGPPRDSMTASQKEAADRPKLNNLWVAISSVAQIGALALVLWLAARALGPGQFGDFSVAMLLAGIFQILANAGLRDAIIQSRELTDSLFATTARLNLATSLVIFAALWLLAPWLTRSMGAPQALTGTRIAAVGFVITAFGSPYQALLEKRLMFAEVVKIEAVYCIAQVLLAALAAIRYPSATAFVAASTAAAAVKSAALLRAGRPRVAQLSRIDSRGKITDILRFGMYRMAENLANLASKRVDQLVVTWLLGPTSLGLYVFGWRLTVEPSMRVNQVYTRVLFPTLSASSLERPQMQELYFAELRLITVITIPLTLGLAAIADLAVPVLFGSQWNSAVHPVQLLAIAAMCRTIVNPVGTLLLALGRVKQAFVWNCGIMIPTIGAMIIGASSGSLYVFCVTVAIMHLAYVPAHYWFLLRPIFPMLTLAKYLSQLARIAFASVCMAATVYVIPNATMNIAPIVWLSCKIAIAVVIYVALLQWLEPSLLHESCRRLGIPIDRFPSLRRNPPPRQ